MSHTITDPSKLGTLQIKGDLATINGLITAQLRLMAAGDKIIDISIVKNNHNNRVVAYITFEDQ